MTRPGLRVLAPSALLLAGITTAQSGPHVFDIVQNQSSFSFSGTATVPSFGSFPIQGNPSTFQVSGGADMDLLVSGSALTAGQLVQRDSSVQIPTLNASVPNPIPILPPLATMRVSGLRVVFLSVDPVTEQPSAFPITGGNFGTSVIALALAGNARIDILGSVQNVSLAGLQAPPQPVSGTISSTAGGLGLNVPIATSFTFVDPGGSGSVTVNLNGTIVANDRALAGDIRELSLGAGGQQTLRLSAGSQHAGRAYLLLTNLSGTSPGLNVNGVNLPLNPDSLLLTSALSANAFPWTNNSGTLDGLGIGTAAFGLPGGLFPFLSGLTFNHAYIVIDGRSQAVFASNPVGLQLIP